MDTEDYKSWSEFPPHLYVAFAVRAAMRVTPLTSKLPSPSQMVITKAISAGEQFAVGKLKSNPAEIGLLQSDIYGVWNGLVKSDSDPAEKIIEAAVKSAIDVVDAIMSESREDVATFAGESARHALAAASMNNENFKLFEKALDHDLSKLKDFLQQSGTQEDLDISIDPSESGPLGSLWPDGAPEWFSNPTPGAVYTPVLTVTMPAEESLTFEAFVDEFADTEEVAEALADLVLSLNAYHIACGGNGLVMEMSA